MGAEASTIKIFMNVIYTVVLKASMCVITSYNLV